MSFINQYSQNSRFKNHVLYLKMRGEELPAKDSSLQGGKSDPYFQLRKAHGIVQTQDGFVSFDLPQPGVYMGEQPQKPAYDGKGCHVKNTLNPQWPAIEIDHLSTVCDDGDIHLPILIDVWDYDWDKANDFMGFVVISIFDLFQKHADREAIPLQPGKPGHTWGGSIFVDEIELVAKHGKYMQFINACKNEFNQLSSGKPTTEPERVRRSLTERLSPVLGRLDVSMVPDGENRRGEAIRRLESLAASAASFDINRDNKITWEEFWTLKRYSILSPLLSSGGGDLQASAVGGDGALTVATSAVLDQLIIGHRV